MATHNRADRPPLIFFSLSQIRWVKCFIAFSHLSLWEEVALEVHIRNSGVWRGALAPLELLSLHKMNIVIDPGVNRTLILRLALSCFTELFFQRFVE